MTAHFIDGKKTKQNKKPQRSSRIRSEQEVLKQNEAKELGAWWGMENCIELHGELKSERTGTPGQLPWPREAEHHQRAGRSHGLTASVIMRAADPWRGG